MSQKHDSKYIPTKDVHDVKKKTKHVLKNNYDPNFAKVLISCYPSDRGALTYSEKSRLILALRKDWAADASEIWDWAENHHWHSTSPSRHADELLTSDEFDATSAPDMKIITLGALKHDKKKAEFWINSFLSEPDKVSKYDNMCQDPLIELVKMMTIDPGKIKGLDERIMVIQAIRNSKVEALLQEIAKTYYKNASKKKTKTISPHLKSPFNIIGVYQEGQLTVFLSKKLAH